MKAKKVIRGEFTGIFRQPDTIIPSDIPVMINEMMEQKRKWLMRGEKANLKKTLDSLKQEANKVINLPDKYPAWVVNNANEVFMGVDSIGQLMALGMIERAILTAIDLGQNYMRLWIRACGVENFSLIGRKSSGDLNTGNKDRRTNAQAQHDKIEQEINKRLEKRGKRKQPSKTEITRQVLLAKNFGNGIELTSWYRSQRNNKKKK